MARGGFCSDLSWHSESWWGADMSPQEAESLLFEEDKEGCFVIRNSSTCKGLYSLSLYTKHPDACVEHYGIYQNTKKEFYLFEQQCFTYIPNLVGHYMKYRGGLVSKLTTSPVLPTRPVLPADPLSCKRCKIDHTQLEIFDEVLGSGAFGVVKKGKWLGNIDVAVKMVNEGAMSEEEFIAEAEVMTQLQHKNLVHLHGVCSDGQIYIVTEYMERGSLRNFLLQHGTSLNVSDLLKICKQVCEAMVYLESKSYVHRDLAARNCLVGSDYTVKVSDFGLTRYARDSYVSQGNVHPIRWEPPEILNGGAYTSKSDVWAYGVVMWEVFTGGKLPYPQLSNLEVKAYVTGKNILEKPQACPEEVYDVMKNSWYYSPGDRPSFSELEKRLFISELRLKHPAAPSNFIPFCSIGILAILLVVLWFPNISKNR